LPTKFHIHADNVAKWNSRICHKQPLEPFSKKDPSEKTGIGAIAHSVLHCALVGSLIDSGTAMESSK